MYLEQGATSWSYSQYEAAAQAKARATAGNFIIAIVGHDGSFVRGMSYPSYAAASSTWDARYAQNVTSKPAEVAFATLFDRTRAVDEQFVEASLNERVSTTTVIKKKTDWKSAVPWIVGGVLVFAVTDYLLLGGLAMGGKKTKKRKMPTWRRRIVTTWR